jgi:UDP-glucose 4-epimerase
MLRDLAAATTLKYAALRYFNVAGADPLGRMGQRTPEATHLIKVSCQAALGMRDRVAVFGSDYDTPDGTGIRDYIHIEDLAAAHLAALAYLEREDCSITVNVGYGRGSSVREVIDVVKRVSGTDFRVAEEPRRPGDPAMLVSVADRVKGLLDWQPRYDSLEKIVADAWLWEQKIAAKSFTGGV